MEIGLVQKINIDSEMQQAYLDYAMSVIVARALPDARDGLKPVHRRILYAMYDMGMRPDSPYKKSARIVGEVLGKYHPHGDMAVYEAMARMAQDFSMRYRLVDGQGNFGSVDGDPPAAMRYTEARLHFPATEMLADIGKNTVDFDDNFDGTLEEPSVLPSALPNLLVNGATGIAVGMSTNIPPHNLVEVVDALRFLLERWEKMDDLTVEDLMAFIKGPDFPTGGIIFQEPGDEGLISAYASGRGKVIVQARVHLEEMERGRSRIIVTELPYMTNKAALIERIAELTREEKLEGIADLRDESDRHGMRIVIELRKEVNPETLLRDLYKHTPMQSTFGTILLALVDGEPRLLSLKSALRVYIEHRLEIVRRRSQYDLERARQRAHILEGLRVALKNLDEVIELIRKAPDVEAARSKLMKRFKLSDVQATAILDMPLRRLAALERKKIDEEYKQVQAQIKELESLLSSPKRMRGLVGEELQAVKEAYGDPRRTQIVHLKEGESRKSLLTATDMTPEATAWVAVTPDGKIARIPEEKLAGFSGADVPAWLLKVNSRDTLYLASESGETAAVLVHVVPEAASPSAGLPLSKVSPLREGSRLAGLFSLPPKVRAVALPEAPPVSPNGNTAGAGFILTVTRQGFVKKTSLAELPGPSANLFTLVKVNDGDRLGWARLSGGDAEVLLVTAGGMAIRFTEAEVRPMGLVAAGVMGIKLAPGDEVVGTEILSAVGPKSAEVLLAASDGFAKRVSVADFPKQGRYGQGLVAWKTPAGVRVVAMAVANPKALTYLRFEKLPSALTSMGKAPKAGRAARGGALIALRKGEDRLVGMTVLGEITQSTPAAAPKETVRRPAAKGSAAEKKAKTSLKTTSTGKRKEPPTRKPAKPAEAPPVPKAPAGRRKKTDERLAAPQTQPATGASSRKRLPEPPSTKADPVQPSKPKAATRKAATSVGTGTSTSKAAGKPSAAKPGPQGLGVTKKPADVPSKKAVKTQTASTGEPSVKTPSGSRSKPKAQPVEPSGKPSAADDQSKKSTGQKRSPANTSPKPAPEPKTSSRKPRSSTTGSK